MLNIKKPLILLTVLISFTVTGCLHKETYQKKEIISVDKNQYLNMTLESEPQGLDPSKDYDTSSIQVLTEVNEALTRIEKDKSGNEVVKPAGAKGWKVTSDGLNWTFYLRNNKWSDGRKVTAKDYEYGIKRTLNPNIRSKKAYLLYNIKGAKIYNTSNYNVSSDIVSVKALDDNTLKITLEAPCAYFLKLTSFSFMQPQREDIVKKYTDKYGSDSNSTVFCGPFLLKQWIHGDRVELIKNNNYWDKNSVKLQKATMEVLKENNTIYSRLLNGSIDIANIIQPDLKNKLDKQNKFNVISVSEPTTDFDVFNQSNKYFKNVNIRKAFSLAVDREEVSKTLWKGLYTSAYGLVSPSIQIGNENFRKKVNQEPVKQLQELGENPKKLLNKGLKEIGFDGDPSSITITYLEPDTDYEQKNIAEFLKNMYQKNLGINIKVEYVPWDKFESKILSGNYEFASMIWTADFNDPLSELLMWSKDSQMVKINWNDKNYDSLIKKAAILPQSQNDQRLENLKKAENILITQDAVISPIDYRNNNVYKRKYIKNLMCNSFGSLYEIKYAYTNGR